DYEFKYYHSVLFPLCPLQNAGVLIFNSPGVILWRRAALPEASCRGSFLLSALLLATSPRFILPLTSTSRCVLHSWRFSGQIAPQAIDCVRVSCVIVAFIAISRIFTAFVMHVLRCGNPRRAKTGSIGAFCEATARCRPPRIFSRRSGCI
ncbi:hypothetical protein, partial [Pantoea sp. Pa-EAmG]|uniref:hypothetical protein n=1 Tax=Pantoea sp. Pa-EAmG TaxID=3043311 RepID=UPI0024AECE49